MRAEAGRTLVVPRKKTCPSFGKAQQPQGMPSRRCIENNVIIPSDVARQQADKFVERRNLGRAGP